MRREVCTLVGHSRTSTLIHLEVFDQSATRALLVRLEAHRDRLYLLLDIGNEKRLPVLSQTGALHLLDRQTVARRANASGAAVAFRAFPSGVHIGVS